MEIKNVDVQNLLENDYKMKVVDILKSSDDKRNKYMNMRQTIIDHFKSQNPQVIVATNIELTEDYGAHKINEELFRLIRKCNYFIADITPM